MKGCTQNCPLFRTKTVKEPEEFIYLVSAMEKQCICPKTTARSNLETSMSWIKKDSLKYGNILKNYEDPKSDDVSDGEDSYISFCHCQWSQGGKSQRRKSREERSLMIREKGLTYSRLWSTGGEKNTWNCPDDFKKKILPHSPWGVMYVTTAQQGMGAIIKPMGLAQCDVSLLPYHHLRAAAKNFPTPLSFGLNNRWK